MSSAAPPTPIWRAVAVLAGPAIVAGLVSTLVFFTDRLLLGRYDDLALGSMQVSGPLLWSVFSVGRALLSGALAVVGRAIGASDVDTARRATFTAVLTAGTLGALVGAVGYSQTSLIADVLAGTGPDTAELRALAELYMAVVFPVAPLVFFAETGIVCIQARGDTTTPLRIGLVAELANVVVSAVLLFGIGPFPELGIRGAALGTATSFVILALLTAYALAQGPFALRRADLHGGLARIRDTLRPIVRVSLPTFGEKVIFHTGFLVFATLVGRLGETAMTANQSLIAIESVGFMTATGFGIASGALVAQALGARDPARARTIGWTSAGLGALSLGIVGIAFLAIPEVFVRWFTDDPDVIALGARCLRVAAIAQPIMAVCDALAGGLRGAGDTRSPMVVALVGPVVVRLVACWVLTVELGWGLMGIWVGTTLDWTVRMVWLAVVWARGRWVDRAEARVSGGGPPL
jgi:putative MATE family efflux protein